MLCTGRHTCGPVGVAKVDSCPSPKVPTMNRAVKEDVLVWLTTFLLHYTGSWVYVHHLSVGEMALRCTMESQACEGSEIWAMFCWENFGLDIHVDVTLIRTTYLNIAAEQVHPFMLTVFPNHSGIFSRTIRPATLYSSGRVWGAIRLSISGMY